ncbi:hypothetical protein C7M84_024234 [Penaeus vannamei]|uniref:Uncharacterized protein n=1 Tax=Penaeus vannamei TaxID=6689 RepID=A0A3R7PDB6_PENVA|nr:hypothetical protein C7M84_024234 [Penaeus vannamei]
MHRLIFSCGYCTFASLSLLCSLSLLSSVWGVLFSLPLSRALSLLPRSRILILLSPSLFSSLFLLWGVGFSVFSLPSLSLSFALSLDGYCRCALSGGRWGNRLSGRGRRGLCSLLFSASLLAVLRAVPLAPAVSLTTCVLSALFLSSSLLIRLALLSSLSSRALLLLLLALSSFSLLSTLRVLSASLVSLSLVSPLSLSPSSLNFTSYPSSLSLCLFLSSSRTSSSIPLSILPSWSSSFTLSSCLSTPLSPGLPLLPFYSSSIPLSLVCPCYPTPETFNPLPCASLYSSPLLTSSFTLVPSPPSRPLLLSSSPSSSPFLLAPSPSLPTSSPSLLPPLSFHPPTPSLPIILHSPHSLSSPSLPSFPLLLPSSPSPFSFSASPSCRICPLVFSSSSSPGSCPYEISHIANTAIGRSSAGLLRLALLLRFLRWPLSAPCAPRGLGLASFASFGFLRVRYTPRHQLPGEMARLWPPSPAGSSSAGRNHLLRRRKGWTWPPSPSWPHSASQAVRSHLIALKVEIESNLLQDLFAPSSSFAFFPSSSASFTSYASFTSHACFSLLHLPSSSRDASTRPATPCWPARSVCRVFCLVTT